MVQFLPLQKEHIEKAVALMTDFYAIDHYPIDPVVSAKNFDYFIDHPELGNAFLITYEQQIVGYIILAKMFSFEFGGTIAFFDELYIDGSMRGKGLGKKAVAFVQEYAKKEGLKVLYLEVEPHNMSAQELYKKMNFQMHHRHLMIHKNQ